MNYEAKNLPFALFEKIGMTKRQVLGMPKEDLLALLSGRTTSLKNITIKTDAGEVKKPVKLSLYSMADNSLNIKIHPYREEIKNDFNFKPREIERLKAGELIVAPKISQNGEKEKHVFQLDRDINEIKSIRVNSINIPGRIDDVPISPKQKAELLEGKPVDLITKDGEVRTIAIDLLSSKGYSVLNENPDKSRDSSYKELINKSSAKDSNRTSDKYPVPAPSENKEFSNRLKR